MLPVYLKKESPAMRAALVASSRTYMDRTARRASYCGHDAGESGSIVQQHRQHTSTAGLGLFMLVCFGQLCSMRVSAAEGLDRYGVSLLTWLSVPWLLLAVQRA
jgi:hypothetical protein